MKLKHLGWYKSARKRMYALRKSRGLSKGNKKVYYDGEIRWHKYLVKLSIERNYMRCQENDNV